MGSELCLAQAQVVHSFLVLRSKGGRREKNASYFGLEKLFITPDAINFNLRTASLFYE